LHGEAVATGMLMAADLSARHQWLPTTDVVRIERLLQRAGLPVRPPREMDTAHFLKLMAVDKKVVDGGLRLVLLKAIGTAVVSGDFDAKLLHETLDTVT
jgi:3-dehydroquinate synthase